MKQLDDPFYAFSALLHADVGVLQHLVDTMKHGAYGGKFATKEQVEELYALSIKACKRHVEFLEEYLQDEE